MSNYQQHDIDEIAGRLGGDVGPLAGATILISGGAGFLGSYFTALFAQLNREALATPCRVIVCDNLLIGSRLDMEQIDEWGFRFQEHDVIEPLTLDEPVDYIIHTAGIASPHYYRMYPLETLDVATIGTRRLLQLGADHHVKSFLFFSSSEIYGDPTPVHVPTAESYRGNISCLGPRACYDESKRLGETLCLIFHDMLGLSTKIVRPFNVYGPGMRESDYRVLPNFVSRVVGNLPLHVYGTGNQTRTFCYVTDALVGFVKALLHGVPASAYNIGNPVPEISMLELAQRLEKSVGRPLEIEVVEYPDTYPGDEPQRRCPDVSKAALQLGYRPQVELDDGLNRFVSWATTVYTGSQF